MAQRSDWRSGAALVGALLLALCLTRSYSYLLFHTLVELFTVAVAWSMFFLVWNARRFLEDHYLLLLGIASLFVGVIDAVHMLTYKGMMVLPGHGANLPTQLWIAGRYVQSLSFLAAPLFLRRRLRLAPAIAAYSVITAAVLAATLSGSGLFPDCYVEGAGLTRFKIVGEYVVSAISLASILLLLKHRAAFDGAMLRWLTASIALTMAAELAFTLYGDVYGAANVAGHLFRFVAYCLVYQAVIVTGLVRPYDLLFRELAHSDERHRVFVANTSEGIYRIEMEPPVPVALPDEEHVRGLLQHGRVAECNDAFARMHGCLKAGEIIGKRLADVAPALNVRLGDRTVQAETCETPPGGTTRWFESTLTGVVENGCVVRVWGVQRDISERRFAAMERERLITELQHALAEVKTLSGLLPICAGCKKIRDDGGYWTQVEVYVKQRADVEFSHSICPECARKLYPDFYPDAG